jgi:hypothetical protein
MDIWQRNTSVAGVNGATAFTADRWNAYRTVAGSTFTRQTTSDTTNLPNIQYCLRVSRDSGNTATNLILTQQSIETANSLPFAGQTVTVSFYARKGANYSATSNLLNYEFITGTGTDQNPLTGYTGQVVTAGTKTLTATWQRFTYTQIVPATATEISLDFYFTPTGTAGAADYFEITGVQLELGSYATTFSRAGGTIQGELAACQRYYQFIGGTAAGFPIVGGNASAASQEYRWPIPFVVQMRVAPTITKNGTWAVGVSGQPSAVFINNQGFSIQITTTGSGATYAFPNATTDTLTISAEL